MVTSCACSTASRQPRAFVVVAALDRKYQPPGRETVYVGTVVGATIRIPEFFRVAVHLNASAIVLAHNDPSGDPTGPVHESG